MYAACLERLASLRGPAAVATDLPQVPAADEALVADLPPPPTDPSQFSEWRRELVELSMQAGETKGKADGLREGKADGLREALKVILAARGIDVPATARARLDGTQDADELRRWTARALTATTWDDLLREGA